MPKLLKGDLVRCVDATGRPGLKTGKWYQVEGVHSDSGLGQYLYIVGLTDPLPFRATRFEREEV